MKNMEESSFMGKELTMFWRKSRWRKRGVKKLRVDTSLFNKVAP